MLQRDCAWRPGHLARAARPGNPVTRPTAAAHLRAVMPLRLVPCSAVSARLVGGRTSPGAASRLTVDVLRRDTGTAMVLREPRAEPCHDRTPREGCARPRFRGRGGGIGRALSKYLRLAQRRLPGVLAEPHQDLDRPRDRGEAERRRTSHAGAHRRGPCLTARG